MTLLVFAAVAALAGAPIQEVRTSIAGAWTLNKELSDQPAGRGERGGGDGRGDDGGRRGGGFGGGRRGGGFGGGGFGGRGGGAGRGGGRQQMDPDEMARMREAMGAILDAQDHLVITETDSMIVITSQDGRTTRLSPDGKKIKDDNTKIERKTRWEGGKLVSEINGAGPGKMVQTFTVDPESRQLRIVLQIEGNRARTMTRVYDLDKR